MLARTAVLQTILQPSGLFVLPVALLITLPFGWVFAFYQNATVLGGGVQGGVKELFRKALRQAELWPGQNHLLLLLLSSFGLFVFLNVALGAMMIPQLVKMLSGVELAFVTGRAAIFNTTFLATVCGVTYLCLDPLIKAVYVLRCFSGESLHSAEDLKAELKGCLSKNGIATAALAAFLISWPAMSINAGTAGPDTRLSANLVAEPASPGAGSAGVPAARTNTELERPSSTQPGNAPPTGARPSVSSAELDRSIGQVISQREYSWRLPRQTKDKDADQPRGLLGSFVDSLVATFKSWARAVADSIDDLIQWLAKKLSQWLGGARRTDHSAFDWMGVSRWLLVALLAVVASVLAIAFLRLWRSRRRAIEDVTAKAILAVPDLADENIVASQLPEDDWLKLARELAEQGDLRRALRALFLASLAHLAQRDLIALARFKSNREYEKELQRRARTLLDLQAAFAQNVGIYDRVWYGMHEASQELVDGFTVNLQRIKAC